MQTYILSVFVNKLFCSVLFDYFNDLLKKNTPTVMYLLIIPVMLHNQLRESLQK